MSKYKKNSLSLTGTVAMGTGVMIGAGIFALLGQVAELNNICILMSKFKFYFNSMVG